jgi:hypothetical protein
MFDHPMKGGIRPMAKKTAKKKTAAKKTATKKR